MVFLDRDECLMPNICPATSECKNHPGSYNCECHSGYEGVACTGTIYGFNFTINNIYVSFKVALVTDSHITPIIMQQKSVLCSDRFIHLFKKFSPYNICILFDSVPKHYLLTRSEIHTFCKEDNYL